MIYSTLVCAFSALALASPITKRQSGALVVTGAAGDLQPRREIRDLANNDFNQFSLYVQALQVIQEMDKTDPLSHYAIGAIHGWPAQAYDGVEGTTGVAGYCTHGSVLFPSWHRPYVALFEQAMSKAVNDLVPKYRDPAMDQAAATFRIPYFDWAVKPDNGPGFPEVMSSQNITIRTPAGNESISNPLYSYKFPSMPTELGQYWADDPMTVRYPVHSTNGPDTSNDNGDVTVFEHSVETNKAAVWKMFQNCNDYTQMASHSAEQNGSCISLESIHDGVHVDIGGGGHMNDPAVAGFDPAFMLHHANVDRLFALWQALYPDVYGASENFGSDANGGFWTTNSVRNWWTFNYTYPEFQASDVSAEAIRATVSSLYAPAPTPTVQSLVATNAAPSLDYVAQISAPMGALNGSYSIGLFFGAPATASDLSSWFSDPAYAGRANVFASSDMRMNNAVVNPSVPLTSALSAEVEKGDIKNLSEDEVKPFLKEKLQWRIAKADGTVVDKVEGLDIKVLGSDGSVAFDG
ncbi:hypothetical protein H2203_003130 [Taxawa tesnikishii (nom. ined.)]|nr:hypothetical protein H2203_003130 [Dothideales sp. JES 119]